MSSDPATAPNSDGVDMYSSQKSASSGASSVQEQCVSFSGEAPAVGNIPGVGKVSVKGLRPQQSKELCTESRHLCATSGFPVCWTAALGYAWIVPVALALEQGATGTVRALPKTAVHAAARCT